MKGVKRNAFTKRRNWGREGRERKEVREREREREREKRRKGEGMKS